MKRAEGEEIEAGNDMIRHETGENRQDQRDTPILRRGEHPDRATRDHPAVAGEREDAFREHSLSGLQNVSNRSRRRRELRK
jgi:hypothetical protein